MSGWRARCRAGNGRSLFRWRYGSRGRALGSGAGSRWGPWLPVLSLSEPAGARARARQLPASLTSRHRTAAATRGSARRRPPLSRQPPAIKGRARMTASSSATATRPVPSPHLTGGPSRGPPTCARTQRPPRGTLRGPPSGTPPRSTPS